MIQVSLNGEPVSLNNGNLLQAMQDWCYIVERSAVAVNGEFVARSSYAEVELNEGDKIDVVGAVGGG